MKKILSLLISFLLAVCFVACSEEELGNVISSYETSDVNSVSDSTEVEESASDSQSQSQSSIGSTEFEESSSDSQSQSQSATDSSAGSNSSSNDGIDLPPIHFGN